jgi:hypothetical protein
MDKEVISISSEDLKMIQNAKNNVVYMRAMEEKAALETRVSELEVKNIILMTYIKYGLSIKDTIENDGKIIYAEESSQEQLNNTKEKVI